ncbi:hypothetical protein GQF49_00640 [Microbacter sp. ANSKLAB05]|nr:hypothetical protein [Microbacter sp. ANSKLAB05]
MDIAALASYISKAVEAESSPWSDLAIRDQSAANFPADILLGPNSWILKGDIHLAWTKWYVDGLIGAKYGNSPEVNYGDLYMDVKVALREIYPSTTTPDRNKLAKVVANFAWAECQRRRNLSRRRSLSEDERYQLWISSGNEPGCYLCGRRFDLYAEKRFFGEQKGPRSTLPRLLDFTRPAGLASSDLDVEIDHVNPLAKGGDSEVENLRLACGWCNRVKSKVTNFYEIGLRSRGNIKLRTGRSVYLPDPRWVLRLVALTKVCRHVGGCEASLETTQLFIAPIPGAIELTPVTGAVYCGAHDPWKDERFVDRRRFGT